MIGHNHRADKKSYHLFNTDDSKSFGVYAEVDSEYVAIWHHGELTLIENKNFEIMIKKYNELKTGGVI